MVGDELELFMQLMTEESAGQDWKARLLQISQVYFLKLKQRAGQQAQTERSLKLQTEEITGHSFLQE